MRKFLAALLLSLGGDGWRAKGKRGSWGPTRRKGTFQRGCRNSRMRDRVSRRRGAGGPAREKRGTASVSAISNILRGITIFFSPFLDPAGGLGLSLEKSYPGLLSQKPRGPD